MLDRGKLLILGVLSFAVVIGAFGLWFQQRQRKVALEFWGADGGVVVRDAAHLSLARLELTAEEDAANIQISDRAFRVIGSRRIDGVPGVIKLRLALLENRAFQRDEPAASQPNWKYLLLFHEADRQVSVVLDQELQRIRYNERDREAGVSPISKFLRQFVSDHLPPE